MRYNQSHVHLLWSHHLAAVAGSSIDECVVLCSSYLTYYF